MPYLTPDTLPSGTVCRTVLIPDDIEWLAIVNGALSRLIHASNFEQFGSITPEETAERFQQMFFEFRDSECAPVTPIGTITMFGSDTPPAGWLVCDGELYSRATYAELFAVIGEVWGAGDESTTFNVPNFVGKSPWGSGFGGDTGDSAGSPIHIITVAQLPVHSHQQTVNISTPAVQFAAGSGAIDSFSGVASSDTDPLLTQPVGSGNPISIVHPVRYVPFIIYAGV